MNCFIFGNRSKKLMQLSNSTYESESTESDTSIHRFNIIHTNISKALGAEDNLNIFFWVNFKEIYSLNMLSTLKYFYLVCHGMP